MAKVVEALAAKPRPGEQRLELAGNGDAVHRRADRRREDQPARVVLQAGPGEEPHGKLPGTVGSKPVGDDRWQGHHSVARG